jgi:hypothetical protein
MDDIWQIFIFLRELMLLIAESFLCCCEYWRSKMLGIERQRPSNVVVLCV